MRENDPKKKLIDYFERNLKKGYTEESLKWALIKQGYSRIAIEEAIKETHKVLAQKAPILKEKPVIKYEVLDENNEPVEIKKSWLKKLFRK